MIFFCWHLMIKSVIQKMKKKRVIIFKNRIKFKIFKLLKEAKKKKKKKIPIIKVQKCNFTHSLITWKRKQKKRRNTKKKKKKSLEKREREIGKIWKKHRSTYGKERFRFMDININLKISIQKYVWKGIIFNTGWYFVLQMYNFSLL